MFAKWLLSVLSLASSGLVAQPQPDQPEDPAIIVEGVRSTEREIEGFVNALAYEPGITQLSRFHIPVCPMVAGLQPSQNQAIVTRMRRVAAAAGIPTAPEGCEPNILVAVTRTKKSVIEQLRREKPAYFLDVSLAEVRRLTGGDTPAAAWQVQGLLSHAGDIVQRDVEKGAYTTVSDPHRGASRIAVPSHPHFIFSGLVVEMDAVAGLSTTQLADYAALRTFARIDPRRIKDARIPTILRSLDTPVGSAVPLTLTRWDLAYLKALYGTHFNQLAAQQRGDMRRRFSDDLQGKASRDR